MRLLGSPRHLTGFALVLSLAWSVLVAPANAADIRGFAGNGTTSTAGKTSAPIASSTPASSTDATTANATTASAEGMTRKDVPLVEEGGKSTPAAPTSLVDAVESGQKGEPSGVLLGETLAPVAEPVTETAAASPDSRDASGQGVTAGGAAVTQVVPRGAQETPTPAVPAVETAAQLAATVPETAAAITVAPLSDSTAAQAAPVVETVAAVVDQAARTTPLIGEVVAPVVEEVGAPAARIVESPAPAAPPVLDALTPVAAPVAAEKAAPLAETIAPAVDEVVTPAAPRGGEATSAAPVVETPPLPALDEETVAPTVAAPVRATKPEIEATAPPAAFVKSVGARRRAIAETSPPTRLPAPHAVETAFPRGASAPDARLAPPPPPPDEPAGAPRASVGSWSGLQFPHFAALTALLTVAALAFALLRASGSRRLQSHAFLALLERPG